MSDAVRPVAIAPPTPEADAPATRRFTPMQLWWSFVIVAELGFIVVVLLLATSQEHFMLDYRIHMEASQRLLDTGSPYAPYQLERPYTIWDAPMPIFYPPIAFVLFVPFLWLPPILWWAIPIAVLVWGMTRHRPPLWGWALALALLCWPQALGVFLFGNPGMWIAAFIAAGTVLGWPFALVFLKPTFAPIALLGMRHGSWWITVGVMAGLSLLLLPLWLQWITVLRNAAIDPSYNVPSIPLMVAPLIPWLLDPRHPIHGWIARQRARLSPVPA